jgi:hypothetical protein
MRDDNARQPGTAGSITAASFLPKTKGTTMYRTLLLLVCLLSLLVTQWRTANAQTCPAGSSTYIQYNTSGSCDAEAPLAYDETNDRLKLTPITYNGADNSVSGTLFIDNTNNLDAASPPNRGYGFHLYSNADVANNLAALAKIDQVRSGDTFNAPGLLIDMQSTNGGAAHIRLDGPAPQIEWVEAGLTSCTESDCGKYETQVNGDFFNLAGRRANNTGFETFARWLRPRYADNRYELLATEVGAENIANDSPLFRLTGRYDATSGTGINWSDYKFDIFNDVSVSGGTASGVLRIRNNSGTDIANLTDTGTFNAIAYRVNGTAGLNQTLSVRNNGGLTDCNITVTNGIITASTC